MDYLDFIPKTIARRKTAYVEIRSKSNGVMLGSIEWYGAWRQYCFWPLVTTVWSTGCLEQVKTEIERLMAERRKRK